MELRLAGTTVLVTGAGQGLGRAIGLAFAQEGAWVAFHYNSSAEGAQKAAAEVNATGGAALAVHADLRDDAAVEAAAELRILTWICVEDAGRIIHPRIVDGQIAGSIAQGIGGALYEHLIYDADGNLSTGSLLDYLMPTSAEIPELVIGHVANAAANPLGVRGVGEGGTLGPAAALAGAVGDALGVAVDQLPITPSGLWELMQPELPQ